MQLSYRGTPYTHELISVDRVDSEVAGSYRGQAFQVAYPRHIPVPQPARNSAYRGVSYSTVTTGGHSSHESKHTVTVPPTESVSILSCLRLPTSKVQTTEYDRIHRSNIQQRLQHRIEVAKAKGDQKLLSLLEHEMQQAG